MSHASQVNADVLRNVVVTSSVLPLKLKEFPIFPVVDFPLVFAADVPLLTWDVESATVVLAAWSSSPREL